MKIPATFDVSSSPSMFSACYNMYTFTIPSTWTQLTTNIFQHTGYYSDINHYILQNETGIKYEMADDVYHYCMWRGRKATYEGQPLGLIPCMRDSDNVVNTFRVSAFSDEPFSVMVQ